MLARWVAVCGVLAAGPALANDSVAELGTGGLVMARTDAITMKSENLYISPLEVTVDYVFENETDEDVNDVLVAFPMPDIDGTVYDRPQIPDGESDNFLGFEVTVDGKPVKPELEQRAIAAGLDITQLLEDNGVPANPFSQPVFQALEKLSDATTNDWIGRGILFIDEYDDGAGWKKVRTPLWTLKSTYWWTSSFPAGKEVKVSHRYRPSVGGSSGLTFFLDDEFHYDDNDYQRLYCIDRDFEQAVLKASRAARDGYLMEQRLDYVLTTGGNWRLGAIGDFKLTVDKGSAKNLVSFCGEGVKKTGPTTFEMTARDFYPYNDLRILIVGPPEEDTGVPASGDEPTGGGAAAGTGQQGGAPAVPGSGD